MLKIQMNSIVEAIKLNSISNKDKICLIDAKGEINYGDYFEKIKKI